MCLRWVGLFRDGSIFTGDDSDIHDSLKILNEYIQGTSEKPKRHFMLWFKARVGDDEYTVSFDDDGDAFLDTPSGKILMTEYKIRSASLVFYVDDNMIQIGFAGIDTTDKPAGKSVLIDNLISNNLITTDIIIV